MTDTTDATTVAVPAAEPVKPPRKPRAKSSFVLVREDPVTGPGTFWTMLTTGTTDKKLMAEALKMGDGDYEVHYVRRKFTVKTKQQTVIE